MKKGIRGHDISAAGLKNLSEKCSQYGFEYLQLVLEKSVEGFETGNFSENYAACLKKELNDTKIAVLGSYINPSNPDENVLQQQMNSFKEKIRYASILNPVVVGTETGRYIDGKTNTEEAYQYLLGNIKELVAEAEKYNVTVGIEGVSLFVINNPEKMARLISDVNSENIKVIFDPCNLLNIDNYMRQDEIINEMFNLLSDRIAVLHAKDFVVEEDRLKRVVPGEGMLNYNLIFKKMAELGMNIPIICEEITGAEALEAFNTLQRCKNLQN